MKPQNKVGKTMKKRMMVTVMAQVMALVFGASLAAAEAGNIPVGGMDLVPSIKVGESHNDNFLSQDGKTKKTAKKSSWITTIEPSFALKAASGANEYELDYKLTRGMYHSSHDDDYTNHAVNFNGNLGLSRRINVTVNAAYNKTADPRGSTFTGTTTSFRNPDLYHETIVGSSVDYGENVHVILSGEYANKRYENHATITKVRDLDTTKGKLEFKSPAYQDLSAVFEANYTVYNYRKIVVDNLNSKEQRYLVGLDWDATAKTSGEARIGYLKKDFTQGSLNRPGFLSWSLNATWEPLTYSSFTVGTSKDTAETAGTANFMISTKYNSSWDYNWSDYLSHNVSWSYSNDAYDNKANPRLDKKTTVGVSVNYQIKRWLSIEPSYEYTNNKSDAAISSYKKNIWMINFIGTL